MAFRVSRERFGQLAEEALKNLPEEYRSFFTNISILVEDCPRREHIEHPDDKTELLGLFSGIPYTEQGGFFDIPPMPDTITLFQKNIESICSTEEELIDEIRKTLVHEVGHYFGMSEEDLDEFEE